MASRASGRAAPRLATAALLAVLALPSAIGLADGPPGPGGELPPTFSAALQSIADERAVIDAARREARLAEVRQSAMRVMSLALAVPPLARVPAAGIPDSALAGVDRACDDLNRAASGLMQAAFRRDTTQLSASAAGLATALAQLEAW